MKQLLSILSPQNCLACDAAGAIFCESCARSISRVPSVRGVTVAQQAASGEALSVPAFAGGCYAETVRDCLLGLKRTGSRELYRHALRLTGEALAQAVAASDPRRQLAFVPVSSGGKTRRGFGGNLVRSLLVDSLEQLRDRGIIEPDRQITVHDHLYLRKIKKSQKAMASNQRQLNVAGALGAKSASSECAVVSHILFDDVITTGSTIREATRALGQAGIKVDAVACVAARPRALGIQAESTLAAYQLAGQDQPQS